MLSEDQLSEVRSFFESPTGQAMFATMETAIIAEWINASSAEHREECWRMFQALGRLHGTLRDAPAMKRLSERAQERRAVRT